MPKTSGTLPFLLVLAIGVAIGLSGRALSRAWASYPPLHVASEMLGQSSIPAQTYGRMTLSAATATAVPATCMAPRASVLIYNTDTAQICCGGDTSVTCSGVHGGYPIASNASASVPLNCDGTRGVVYCYSVAGTATNGVGWWEIR